MSDFPPVGMIDGEDSQQYGVSVEDVAVATPTDGGYDITRPRHTRTPRREYTTGFTDISDADKLLLEAFYEARKGGSQSFTYTDPTKGVEKLVRFKGPLKLSYRGIGGVHRWDVHGIVLKEV